MGPYLVLVLSRKPRNTNKSAMNRAGVGVLLVRKVAGYEGQGEGSCSGEGAEESQVEDGNLSEEGEYDHKAEGIILAGGRRRGSMMGKGGR